MSEQPVRHIVFDIGRVLIHYDPHLAFAPLIPDATERDWFFANVCTHDWNLEQDRGRAWADAEELLIGQYPEHTENIRSFRKLWNVMVPHAYEDSAAIMTGLIDRGWDVTLLTNFASDTLNEARGRFSFLSRPRGATVSAEIGVVKPDPEIYRIHAETFGLEPAATLFIDDAPANVEGAKAAGWQSVLFQGAEKLKRDLKERGIEA